jgi:hypothetical protein
VKVTTAVQDAPGPRENGVPAVPEGDKTSPGTQVSWALKFGTPLKSLYSNCVPYLNAVLLEIVKLKFRFSDELELLVTVMVCVCAAAPSV